ncbi:MAG: hypothetical protein ABIH28_03705 [archaeon]
MERRKEAEERKEKERVIATKINAKIFGNAQLTDMQIHGGWKRGDLKELLEKSLGLFNEVGKIHIKGEKLPEQLLGFVTGTVKGIGEVIEKETKKAGKEIKSEK